MMKTEEKNMFPTLLNEDKMLELIDLGREGNLKEIEMPRTVIGWTEDLSGDEVTFEVSLARSVFSPDNIRLEIEETMTMFSNDQPVLESKLRDIEAAFSGEEPATCESFISGVHVGVTCKTARNIPVNEFNKIVGEGELEERIMHEVEDHRDLIDWRWDEEAGYEIEED